MATTKTRQTKLSFFLQLCFIVIALIAEQSFSDPSTDRVFLTNMGFSSCIVHKSEYLLKLIRLSEISTTNIGEVNEFLSLLKSSWGGHLRPDQEYSSKVRIKMGENIKEIGMHKVIREQAAFISTPSKRSLMIYLGAHPSILCNYLKEIQDLSEHVSHTLISASDQIYKQEDFKICNQLKLSHGHFLKRMSLHSTLSDIMTFYLQGFGVHLKTISYTTPLSLSNEKSNHSISMSKHVDLNDINTSTRLRLHLKHHPRELWSFDKIILVAPQPFGEEARHTVLKYRREGTSVFFLFSLVEASLKDDLRALIALLQTDIELQKKTLPE
ncbi:hypothetical protein ACH42_09910 [Endozoicomonas sp. (ex Bugula neritina AB1)]|nr:hypothetical protein ACH42_09910 [Endozoicomonas sp. (ex Bugula neritina AB1)]